MRVAIEHVLSAREPIELEVRMDAGTLADRVVHWTLLTGTGADLITAVGYEQDHALADAPRGIRAASPARSASSSPRSTS